MYNYLVAIKDYKINDEICFLGNVSCSQLDPRRLQVDNSNYILPPFIIGHSCSPNSYIDWKTNTLRAIESINKGEKIAYHYGTSEDDYRIGKFDCNCGSDLCLGSFKGFKFMSSIERSKIKKYLSPFLKRKYFSIHSKK